MESRKAARSKALASPPWTDGTKNLEHSLLLTVSCLLRSNQQATHLQTDTKTVRTNQETNVAKGQVDF